MLLAMVQPGAGIYHNLCPPRMRRTWSSILTRAQQQQVEQSPRKKASSNLFDWTKAWYPIAIHSELDKRVPHPVTVLGYDVVVWWDKVGGSWQVFDDKCPHRLAPLSEGRISENGHIQCSYHGWTFAPNNGTCSRIPQAPPAAAPGMVASPRACVKVYPSTQQQGILWFSPETKAKPSEKPPVFPVIDDPSFVHYWGTSDLPYGYEALIENLVDPTHVPFAHHKIQGNRERAKPVNYTVNKYELRGFKGEADNGKVVFMPPCSFSMEVKLGSRNKDGTEKALYLVFMCVPVAPGRSKVFWSFPRNFAKWTRFLTPMWLAHLRHMLVLDSDLYLLHLMERKQRIDNRCYTPASADAFVMAFRSWLEMYAGGAPSYAGTVKNELPPSPPKRQLMDRYENHVKHCPTCKGALNVFKAIELGLQGGALAMLILAAVRQTSRFSFHLGLATIVFWLASRWTSQFIEKNYYFHDYNHALVK